MRVGVEAILGFLVGLSGGFVISWLHHQDFMARMRRMLRLFPPQLQEPSTLSPASRLRRAIQLTLADHEAQSAQVAELQVILGTAPLGYLQVNGADQLHWCNDYAREVLKIDRWRPGQPRLLLELVRSYELDQLIALTRGTGQPQSKRWVYQVTAWQPQLTEAEGSDAYAIALQAESLPLAAGDVGIFLINQQQLVDLEQARDRAFTDLAHELRTPLTAIQLVAETLQERLGPPERDWAARMLAEVNRLMALVQDYLDISQLQKQSVPQLDCEAVPLEGLVQEVWQRLAPLAEPKHLVLDYTSTTDCSLWGDRRRLEQVWLNLLDNAIKHSPSQGRIQIRAALDAEAALDPWVVIDVIDAGAGFPEADLERVFERLYRSDRSRQRPPPAPATQPARYGSGLGLAIARAIILAHAGSITARNHPETGGAWLQLRLPGFH